MDAGRQRAFAIKALLDDVHAAQFEFTACKTMYGGKAIAAGDRLFVFADGPGGGGRDSGRHRRGGWTV